LLLGNNPSTHAQSYETIHQFLMLLNLFIEILHFSSWKYSL